MWAVRAILVALLIIIVVAFAYFNFNPAQKVDVNLIYVKYLGVPLVTVVFWSFVAGVLISLILFISVYIRLTVQIRASAKRLGSRGMGGQNSSGMGDVARPIGTRGKDTPIIPLSTRRAIQREMPRIPGGRPWM